MNQYWYYIIYIHMFIMHHTTIYVIRNILMIIFEWWRWMYYIILLYNINPGLVNHSLLSRGYSPNSDNMILGTPLIKRLEVYESIYKWIIFPLTIDISPINHSHITYKPLLQWPFQEPKLEVPTIYFWPIFSGLNFREYPHKLWSDYGTLAPF